MCNRDRVVSKDDLIDSVWRGRVGSDPTLTSRMNAGREEIRLRGDFVGPHRALTAAAGMAGETEAARASLQAPRLAQPNISLAWIAREMPIKQDDEREHYLEAFRCVGMT